MEWPEVAGIRLRKSADGDGGGQKRFLQMAARWHRPRVGIDSHSDGGAAGCLNGGNVSWKRPDLTGEEGKRRRWRNPATAIPATKVGGEGTD